jgi:deoxyadenosine/deoxycytidine kinase
VIEDGKTILELFYEDMVKYAFQFECIVIHHRYKTLQEQVNRLSETCPDGFVLIIERSPIAGREIFALTTPMTEKERGEYNIIADGLAK